MDIFTTQLTRVVPVPIKPTKLKVKALVKEAATRALDETLDEIEPHESYVSPEKQAAKKKVVYSKNTKEESKQEQEKETKDNPPHLDIFV